MPKQSGFLKEYLKLRTEITDTLHVQKPDPIMVLVYSLHGSSITDPRDIHRLLDVPLQQILDRMVKLEFIAMSPATIYSKKPRAKGTERKTVTYDAPVVTEDEPQNYEDSLLGMSLGV